MRDVVRKSLVGAALILVGCDSQQAYTTSFSSVSPGVTTSRVQRPLRKAPSAPRDTACSSSAKRTRTAALCSRGAMGMYRSHSGEDSRS